LTKLNKCANLYNMNFEITDKNGNQIETFELESNPFIVGKIISLYI